GSFSGGKLAMLHEKELVLNKIDTSNLLKAINISKSFMSNFKIPEFNIPQMNPAVAGTGGIEINFNIANLNNTTQQEAVSFATKIRNELAKKGIR
ncbi:MAG TPA: hypothetical protein VIM70_17645, partial [Clostridium sp.]|uniref:hypothetical protein n=1 Tax=Clostridium sp. TaxID=1506 RepID=UPI002F943117